MGRTQIARIGYLSAALLLGLIAVGLGLQQPWATALWPWPDGRLTFIFLSAALAAIAVPAVWIALSGEWGASAGPSLFPTMTAGAQGLFLTALAWPGGQERLALAGVVGLAMAVIGLGLYRWSSRIPLRDTRPLPAPVRWSFAAFVLVLVAVGGALTLGLPDVLPWPVRPETAVMLGWVYLGAAAAYAFAVLRPAWHHARGPLLGFLAYDVVLLPPLLGHFGAVQPQRWWSLVLYTAVLLYSAALAIVYLVLHPATRSWSSHRPYPRDAAGERIGAPPRL